MTESCDMMKTLIEAIHSTPTQAVLYIAGGASHTVGWLTSIPGASNTVLEAVIPYSRMSMIQLLGKIPSQFADMRTAEELALVAYNRALKICKPGCPVLGVGFTGSLATTRPKQGDHRFHMCTRTSNRLSLSTVTLSKGLRTREDEEIISSQFLLKAIASASKAPADFTTELNEFDVCTETESLFKEDEELEQLLSGKICFKVYNFTSERQALSAERKIVLPGSFNPLHEGHLQLMDVASSLLGDGYPCFELSAVNADKPPLTVSQIKERVKQFEMAGKTIIVSNQPYFYKKAELFPGSAFVVGADTVVRLIDPKYYDGSYDRMIDVLCQCKSTGCIFIVGGRNVDGVFKVLEDINVPDVLKDMFIPIPSDKFRMDISSTELRRRLRA
ncbi:uncharacterized protein LOC104908499 isoform X1 [Beta vulgaris subsp. vulgaris]|uniref:uncharacterized protein LOC104908499 isoform X1 n=2 Tax=Beta vulgaris subsp. vulgaris TaxID=3555 RepID=UPI002037581C|nr:uncharacterized protein LOC104908499 isoform X1 [Beta vulgaris subsp. vulgaris]